MAVQIVTPSGSANVYGGMDNHTDPYQRMALAAAAHAISAGEEDARQTLFSIWGRVHHLAVG